MGIFALKAAVDQDGCRALSAERVFCPFDQGAPEPAEQLGHVRLGDTAAWQPLDAQLRVVEAQLVARVEPQQCLDALRGEILRGHHQRRVAPDKESLLRDLEGGTWYLDAVNALERPGFVDDQCRRLDWYPLDMSGDRAGLDEEAEWNRFGKFIGELDLSTGSVTYRYMETSLSGPALQLSELTEQQVRS